MNAVPALDLDSGVLPPNLHGLSRAPAAAVPLELATLLGQSAKMKASFVRLDDRDRRGFLLYIEEAKTTVTRERRAAIIAMSLMGLARDLADDPRG